MCPPCCRGNPCGYPINDADSPAQLVFSPFQGEMPERREGEGFHRIISDNLPQLSFFPVLTSNS